MISVCISNICTRGTVIFISFDKEIQDLLDDAKDPGSDPVAVKAMKTFDLMDKVEVFLI